MLFFYFIGGEFQCKGHVVPHSNPTSIGCCSDEDYCNIKLSPMYESAEKPIEPFEPAVSGWDFELMVLLVCLTLIFVFAFMVIVSVWVFFR